jgi:ribosomal protein L28
VNGVPKRVRLCTRCLKKGRVVKATRGPLASAKV